MHSLEMLRIDEVVHLLLGVSKCQTQKKPPEYADYRKIPPLSNLQQTAEPSQYHAVRTAPLRL